MNDPSPDRREAYRALIEHFLKERLDARREKLPDEDTLRDELPSLFERATWLADAARRVGQIQAVTHSLKPIHPDARGTNLYCAPSSLHHHVEVGSHVLDQDFSADVVGNAAALDVYKFLRLEIDGRSLLDGMLAGDASLAAALSDDADEAAAWIEAFTGLIRPRGNPASHTLAKQLYWLVGDDPLQDGQYHLLAPLYASSLAHRVFLTLNEDRFGESGKAARQARCDKEDHPVGFAEYPNLAVQKLGGTKPQNISQLNSERRGNNYLLGSLPPQWKSRAVRALWHTESAFPRYGQREQVREAIKELRLFLESNPEPTLETRDRRDAYLDVLLDELVCFSREFQEELPTGWTAEPDCELEEAEQLWLDPFRAETDEDFKSKWQRMDWPAGIGQRFGRWLNSKLDKRLPLGEIEQRQWAKELLVDETWAARLHKQLGAPTYIQARRAS